MGVPDQGEENLPEMTMELALMLRKSVQTINWMMDALPEKVDPVSRNALTAFSLSMAAELTTFLSQEESKYILRMVKDLLPRT